MTDNKKRNVVAYVFSGVTVPLGIITIFFFSIVGELMLKEAPEANSAAESFGNALGVAAAVVFALVFAILAGIAAFIFGLTSISILSTCIKETEKKRKIANIIIISIVGFLLLSIIVGAILIFFVFPNV